MSDTTTALELGFLQKDRVHDLMRFIDQYWRRGHVLAKSKVLLDWQHDGTDGRPYDFVVATDKAGEILGVLGFILASRYSQVEDGVLWLAVWQVRSDVVYPGLGISLRSYLTKQVKHSCISAVGLNPSTAAFYKAFGFKTGVLAHHVMVNEAIHEHHILRVNNRATLGAIHTPKVLDKRLVKLSLEDLRIVCKSIDIDGIIPVKNASFLENRYLNHPYYHYDCYGLKSDNGAYSNIIVTRSAMVHSKYKCLRIVDVAGDPGKLAGFGRSLQDILVANGFEYADFIADFPQNDFLSREGFLSVDLKSDDVVVPNYFEPFESKNVPIYFAYKNNSSKKYYVFRGDADQDRPNNIDGMQVKNR